MKKLLLIILILLPLTVSAKAPWRKNGEVFEAQCRVYMKNSQNFDSIWYCTDAGYVVTQDPRFYPLAAGTTYTLRLKQTPLGKVFIIGGSK